jgi:osmotically-inducible protein OsmY
MTVDRLVQERVLAALDLEAALRPAGIGVTVRHGIVTLLGRVEALCERWAAERTVRDVPGVRAVANELTVGRDRPARAPLLAEAVARALAWTVDVPSSAIKVIVWDGFVTLSGTVDREEQRQAAERAVRAVPGVTSVFNAVAVRYLDAPEIEPWLADSLARAGR